MYKLREWVGTVTGKGDRWGRDSVGRSAPAFMAASTTVLPPRTCMARGQLRQLAAVVLLHHRPTVGRLFLQGLCRAESPPAVSACSALFSRLFVCLSNFACHAHCPSQQFLPPFICFSLLAPVHFASLCFAPVHCHVRQDRLGPAVCC